jgi:hypothetical protein
MKRRIVALDPARSSDQDVVSALCATNRQKVARQGPHAPLHAIANHGIADPLGYGEADALRRIPVSPRAYQQNESGHGKSPAGIGREEIRPLR